MISRISIGGKIVVIKTPHNDPDVPVAPSITGDVFAVNAVREILNGATGFYGHLINIDSTTNLDLHSAINSAQEWDVVYIRPTIYPLPLPPGAVT